MAATTVERHTGDLVTRKRPHALFATLAASMCLTFGCSNGQTNEPAANGQVESAVPRSLQQQQARCVTTIKSNDPRLALLSVSARVSVVELCGVGANIGHPRNIHVSASMPQFGRLVASLKLPNTPDPGQCNLAAYPVPSIAAILDDGSVVRPGVGGNRCFPNKQVLDVIAEISGRRYGTDS